MFGSHLSISGSMVNALREAESLGMDTVQVFTKNQQQWVAKPLDAGMVKEWHAEVKRLGWDAGCADDRGGMSRGRIVSHASYLINLASVNEELWRKSVDLMVDEIERCEALGIAFLVHHPGSFVGGDLETGLTNIARAYKELFTRTKGYKVVSCLEGTTGSGSQIGGVFEHLARLRETIAAATGEAWRVGVCLDTCHMHAAGYDLSTREAARKSLAEFDRVCGFACLKCMHLNDSKGKIGSHLDRHMEIGEGEVGGASAASVSKASLETSGFAEVLRHPAVRGVPKCLETPKGLRAGEEWVPKPTRGKVPNDSVNLNRVRWLAGLEMVAAPAEPGQTSVSASKERASAAELKKRATKTSRKTVDKPLEKAGSPGKGAKSGKGSGRKAGSRR
jgi:deoxyribonuclease IV